MTMLEKFKELLYKANDDVDIECNRSSTKDFMKIVCIALVLALLIDKFIVFNAYVPSESMVPTLNSGDRLLVTRVYNLDIIQQGDIVVFYSNENKEHMVKRLIGLPGDTVEIINGKVFVNNNALEESYIEFTDNFSGSYKVPKGKYFFLGDNRPKSFDSRLWDTTYIDGNDIIGLVKFRIHPFKSIGSVK